MTTRDLIENKAKELHGLLCSCYLPINNLVTHEYSGDDFIKMGKLVLTSEILARLDEINKHQYTPKDHDRYIELQQQLKEIEGDECLCGNR